MPKKTSDKAGKPTLSAAVLKKLEEAFSVGTTDLEACLFAEILPSQFKAYLKENPDFAERREILKQRPILLARQTVMKAIKNDPKLAMEFLDRAAGIEK